MIAKLCLGVGGLSVLLCGYYLGEFGVSVSAERERRPHATLIRDKCDAPDRKTSDEAQAVENAIDVPKVDPEQYEKVHSSLPFDPEMLASLDTETTAYRDGLVSFDESLHHSLPQEGEVAAPDNGAFNGEFLTNIPVFHCKDLCAMKAKSNEPIIGTSVVGAGGFGKWYELEQLTGTMKVRARDGSDGASDSGTEWKQKPFETGACGKITSEEECNGSYFGLLRSFYEVKGEGKSGEKFKFKGCMWRNTDAAGAKLSKNTLKAAMCDETWGWIPMAETSTTDSFMCLKWSPVPNGETPKDLCPDVQF